MDLRFQTRGTICRLGPVTPTPIFLSYVPEQHLHSTQNENPKLQLNSFMSSLCSISAKLVHLPDWSQASWAELEHKERHESIGL